MGQKTTMFSFTSGNIHAEIEDDEWDGRNGKIRTRSFHIFALERKKDGGMWRRYGLRPAEWNDYEVCRKVIDSFINRGEVPPTHVVPKLEPMPAMQSQQTIMAGESHADDDDC